jgi:beta-glucosidase
MATVFPQSIGMAASFDDSLVYQTTKAIATELRAVGVRQVYAPVINIARDPRWGRVEETYGEDPFLTSKMGVAYVKALQRGGVIATPKHFVDNYGAGGHDSYASETSWRALYETFLEPFRAVIQEGGAMSIMSAYNSVDGVPCSSNEKLLTDILRKEWGFSGFTVSDYGAVRGIAMAHHTAKDYAEAQAEALQAGLDVELANGYPDLDSLVKCGRLSEKDIDVAVKRVLAAKFRIGLFDHPFADAGKADSMVRNKAHRKLALRAARETMTLLKNDNHTLPLDETQIKRIGVFGPAANILSLGDYTGPYGGWNGEGAVTPYQGLVNRLKGKAEVVLYQPGTDALALAKTCDAVIFFAAMQEGEAQDHSQLTLPAVKQKAAQSTANAQIVENTVVTLDNGDQEQVIKTLAASGIKTIVVLRTGSPVDMRSWTGKTGAILEAWYPGEQGGTAIAETLFGDNDPGGRLPISWPKDAGQIPVYYAVKPSGRANSYIDDDGKPLFPFGYGLSYTSFAYSGLLLPAKVNKGDSVQVKVTVRNTGSHKGNEVVQLYLQAENCPVVQPVKQLKAFKRVSLAPGESKTVTLNLPYRSFGYYDKDLRFVITPGVFTVAINRDAEDALLHGTLTIK